MRILVLSKRQYMGQDLIDDTYGRFLQIPSGLATLGFSVRGLLFSYRKREEITPENDGKEVGGVVWNSVNLGINPFWGLWRHRRTLDRLIHSFEPDVLWAASDAFHIVFGAQAARRHHIPFVADLYDNFESYGGTRLPGVRRSFRVALGKAHGVGVISRALARRVGVWIPPSTPIRVIPNAVDTQQFRPMDRLNCRQLLGLPVDLPLIGTAGALTPDRDISALYEAYDILKGRGLRVGLVVAGSRTRRLQPPRRDDVYDLGLLPYTQVPALFNALDVAVICNRRSEFGCYCFPQKFYEILACKVPLVAAATGDLPELLNDYPECLYEPERPQQLADGIQRQLNTPCIPDLPVPTWLDQARLVADLVSHAIQPLR